MSNSSVCGIMDIPDEILVKIILYFNATERLALANSCQRFNDLVFGDKELLRNLDFTRGRPPTTESDIQQYFDNKNTYKRVHSLNIEYVVEVNNLYGLIGKASNLVELKIMGAIKFESVEELFGLLKPLVHLKRLSVHWPESQAKRSYVNPDWGQSFGKLTYLSLEMPLYSNKFLLILQLCQQLEELRMGIGERIEYERSSSQKFLKLSNLKVVRLNTRGLYAESLREDFISSFPDLAKWTDCHQLDPFYDVHLEKNVEVCAELAQIKKIPLPEYIADYLEPYVIEKCWTLVAEHLLSEVIRVTHQDTPEKFCCLSSSTYSRWSPCRLGMEAAKKLLKDPGYQISFLEFSHVIEKNCDMHLVASAFPNLTGLILPCIGIENSLSEPTPKTKPLCRRLRKKGAPLESEEHSDARNTDSSFKMLVENTPHLRVLIISLGFRHILRKNKVVSWDFDALYLISHWKNLTAIHLYKIPITDGQFLIDIGRECTELEEVVLGHLGYNENCSYESEILQMLQHCRNLKKLSIRQNDLKRLSEMFSILSNSSALRYFYLETAIGQDECDPLELAPAVAKVLCQCQQLHRLAIHIFPEWIRSKLRVAVERIINELNRPNFQFKTHRITFACENTSNANYSSPWVPFPRCR